MRPGLMAGAALLALGWSGAAWGQSLPTYVAINQPVCSPTNGQTGFEPVIGCAQTAGPVSISTEQRIVFNAPTIQSNTTTVRSTQIIGRIGGGAPLYDQTFPLAFSDPAVQGGVTAARAAITSAGGPGVIIGAPVLTASNTTTITSSTTRYTLAGTTLDAIAGVVVGPSPNPIQIGTRSVCTGISSLPSTVMPTCSAVAPVAQYTAILGFVGANGGYSRNINFRQTGDFTSDGAVIINSNIQTEFQDPTPVLLTVPAGLVETNINLITTYTIDQTTTTTETTTIFEQYTITGVVRRIGSVHPLSADAAGDAAGLFAARLRGAGDSELQPVNTRWGMWLKGYGWFGQRGAAGEIAADRRSGEGVTGGFAGQFGNGWSGGIGFDWGRTRLSLPSVGEWARLKLFQAGAHLGWDKGPLSLRLSGSYGWGHIDSVTEPADFAFATAARYDLNTATLSAEAGYALPLGAWRLAPVLGGEWRQVKTDGFTEPGLFGLRAAANSTDLVRGWAGLRLERAAAGGGQLRLYGRATWQGHDRVLLPVTFATLGGPTMVLDSPDFEGIGAEAGASVNLPIASGVWLTAAYDARLRGNLTLHAASGGFRIVF